MQLERVRSHLKLPYTLQWNVALEQALERSKQLPHRNVERRKTAPDRCFVVSPNPNFSKMPIRWVA